MGSDIHLYVEKLVDGVWASADKWSKNKWHEEYPEEEKPVHVEYKDFFYTGRNYTLFGFLANVRQDWVEPNSEEYLDMNKDSKAGRSWGWRP